MLNDAIVFRVQFDRTIEYEKVITSSFYVCTFYESYVSMEYDMKAIKMDQ